MALPFFFEDDIPESSSFFLSEESSKHVIQVLRMAEGEQILATNGKGYAFTCEIISSNKKKAGVKIIEQSFRQRAKPEITIAISLIKNRTRFEWFIEKATEIGVTAIIPLVCKRTENIHFRRERMMSIITSAMLQSRQVWLPELYEPIKISDVIKTQNCDQKFIAHCLEEEKKELRPDNVHAPGSKIILIGPEGDFTEDEIQNALQQNYTPVSLGATRLRTETAGIVAAVLLK